MASVFGIVVTQLQLAIYVGLLDKDPTKSNVVAVMLCAVPSFVVNKRWVWNADGKISFHREIVPFWVFTGAGLALSTLFVEIAHNLAEDSTIIVMIASLGGFGVLWVAKFLFLDQVMFGHSERRCCRRRSPPPPDRRTT